MWEFSRLHRRVADLTGDGMTKVLDVGGLEFAWVCGAGNHVERNSVVDFKVPRIFYILLMDKNGGMVCRIFCEEPAFTANERDIAFEHVYLLVMLNV
jgi:hypothetical protein